jgi:ABC-type uncharacterized transport system auxiliary subunit
MKRLKESRGIFLFIKIISLLCVLIALNGCFSLKSDYPSISFYRLQQDSLKSFNASPVKAVILVRDFKINKEFETEELIATSADTKVERYYYHRWVSDCPGLITDFVVNRFNMSGIFVSGVAKSPTIILPDYYIEGSIMDMMAHNSDSDDPGKNYVTVSIKINLIKNQPDKASEYILLNKIYSSRINRKDDRAENIAVAFSHAVSEISDNILKDVVSVIDSK